MKILLFLMSTLLCTNINANIDVKRANDVNYTLGTHLEAEDFAEGLTKITNNINASNGEAIDAGADVIFELPVCYSVADVSLFALASVALLNSLGVVDYILFGSENGSIEEVLDIAELMQADEYVQLYNSSFEERNCNKRIDALKRMGYSNYSEYVNQPNNMLGINYVTALKKIHFNIVPLTHKRVGQAYMDTEFEGVEGDKVFSSASAIRKCINDAWINDEDLPAKLEKCVPKTVYNWMENNWKKSFPIFSRDFWNLIKREILISSEEKLNEIEGIDKDVAHYIKAHVDEATEYGHFISKFVRDNVNVNPDRRLYRILTKQLKKDLDFYIENGIIFYAKVLGMSSKAKSLMEMIEGKSCVPIIDEKSKRRADMSMFGKKQLANDIEADCLYRAVLQAKFCEEENK